MTEQHPPTGPEPDPTSAYPGTPVVPTRSTHSGDSMPGPAAGPRPPSYRAGSAQVPPKPEREYPRTSEFPAVNPATMYDQPGYAPPGYQPGYAQPGYQQPGYQQPGYQQPGYDQYDSPGYGGSAYPPPPPGRRKPPPPPPRRAGRSIASAAFIVALLLCGGLITAGLLIARGVRDATHTAKGAAAPTTQPTTVKPTTVAPTPTDDDNGKLQHDVTVTYEVTGDGSAEIVYIEKRSGKATHVHADLPWTVTLPFRTPFVLNVTAVRASTDEGSIACREAVDGKTVKQSKSGTGHFNSVTCNYVTVD